MPVASGLLRPLVVLVQPGRYLFDKYSQYKRRRRESARRRLTERELQLLHHKINKLLVQLEENEPEPAPSQEEECVICISARAAVQTAPCGHQAVCRRCFVKTIQTAVSQRLLPLRCVLCRAKVLRLRQTGLPASASGYSMSSAGGTSLSSAGSASCSSAPAQHQGTGPRRVRCARHLLSQLDTCAERDENRRNELVERLRRRRH